MEEFEFQEPVSPPKRASTPEQFTSASLGWSPAQIDTRNVPIGILDDAEHSPIPNEPASRNSVDIAVHRPVAQRLEQVAHPVLLPEALSAEVEDYDEYQLYQLPDSPYGSPGYASAYDDQDSPYENFEAPHSPTRHDPSGPHEFSASPYAESPYVESPYEESPYEDGQAARGEVAAEGVTPVIGEDGFNYVAPEHVVVSQSNDPNSIYYPAPIPSQLKLPPILSHRNQGRSQLPVRKPRPKSMLQLGVPMAREWEPSPIDQEVNYRDDMSEVGSMMVESDKSSYAATNLSDDSYQDIGNEDDYRPGRRVRDRSEPPRGHQNQNWFSKSVFYVLGKTGDPDAKDKELVDNQEDIIDEYEATAFTRYDPEMVAEEAKRFEAGGVYSGVRSNGKPTSLIEELEIRKLGRVRQRQGLLKDSEQARANLAMQTSTMHPLDREHQPTLIELQRMADIDYTDRKKWHQEATMRQRQDRGDESLAQRRARRRAAKKATEVAVPQPAPANETLAQRRARRKAEKEYKDGLMMRTDMDGASVQECLPESASFVESDERMFSAEPIPEEPEHEPEHEPVEDIDHTTETPLVGQVR